MKQGVKDKSKGYSVIFVSLVNLTVIRVPLGFHLIHVLSSLFLDFPFLFMKVESHLMFCINNRDTFLNQPNLPTLQSLLSLDVDAHAAV